MTRRNGKPAPDLLAAALSHEEAIADEAAKVRGDATVLTPDLLLRLWPLLRRPIHEGHIVSTGVVKGKPYASTGVKSVQVLIDRMDAVLTPLWWRDEAEHSEGGKLCRVTVRVGNLGEAPLVERSSMGGVDRASTQGNLQKGSYTNAAKVAFARVGPGHEVYVGATDLDPDVNEDAAKAQAAGREPVDIEARVDAKQAENLDLAVSAAGMGEFLPAKLAGFGAASIGDLTVEQGLELYEWARAGMAGKAAADA